MPALLTQASVLMCPHGGTVTATPSSVAVQVQGAGPVLHGTDTFLVAGCPFVVGTVPSPCTTVSWQVTAMTVKAGDFVLNESSVGLCLAATQAPQGTVLISSTQPQVSGN